MSVTSKLSGRKVKAPHIVVRALAGTGKTTTAVHGTNLVLDPKAAKKAGLKGSEQQDAVWSEMGKDQFRMVEFMAFNNAIANELKSKLPQGCVASTIHAKGNAMNTAAFGYSKPNNWKVYDHLDKIDPKLDTFVKRCVKEVVDLSKLTLTAEVDEGRVELPQDKFEDLVEHYGLNLNGSSDKVFDLSNQVLQSTFDNEKKRDFTDMVWFPVVKGLKCRQSDLVIIDEAQDLCHCQLALVMKAGRRMMFIGDPNQAIYGFAGAGIRSIEDIRNNLGTTETGLTDLKLTYTRRCPKEVVAYAKAIVPDFEALPEAPQGSVDTWTRDGFFQRVKYGDMVLCRTNAPLISHAFRFIRNDRRVKIQGRNIGDNLVSLVNKSKATRVDDLLSWTEDYRNTEIARVNNSKRPSENQIQVIHDRSDCIKYLCEGEKLVSAVIERIKNLFEDIDGTKKNSFILLSSVHRAKGLEAKRVCILHPELLPFPYAKLDWERQQERNLQYVAYTRAMSELVFVK
jgi:DNA helicase II / ATP-dependent DNA helicase PcrA